VNDEQDIDYHSGKPGFGSALWCGIAFILIAYPLSVGPVVKFYPKITGVTPQLIQQFYSPLKSLYDASPTVHRFYDWYFEKLCGVR
jgi:hypothetical protein